MRSLLPVGLTIWVDVRVSVGICAYNGRYAKSGATTGGERRERDGGGTTHDRQYFVQWTSMKRGTCPHCDRWYGYDPKDQGKRCRCDSCGGVFRVGVKYVLTGRSIWDSDDRNREPAIAGSDRDSPHDRSPKRDPRPARRPDNVRVIRTSEPAAQPQGGMKWRHWIIACFLGLKLLIWIGSSGSTRNPTGLPPFAGDHRVQPYERSDGTDVRAHWRTNPDSTKLNNYTGPNGDYYRELSGHR